MKPDCRFLDSRVQIEKLPNSDALKSAISNLKFVTLAMLATPEGVEPPTLRSEV